MQELKEIIERLQFFVNRSQLSCLAETDGTNGIENYLLLLLLNKNYGFGTDQCKNMILKKFQVNK